MIEKRGESFVVFHLEEKREEGGTGSESESEWKVRDEWTAWEEKKAKKKEKLYFLIGYGLKT